MFIGENALLNALLPTLCGSAAYWHRDRWLARSSYASTRLLDRRSEPFSPLQTSSFDTTLIPRATECVDAAEVNLRKLRALSRSSAVPYLGVTCPPFFRCEAPFSHHHKP